MRISVIALFIFLFIGEGKSQFGVRANYNLNTAPKWNSFFNDVDQRNTKVFKTSLSFAIDYWFKLANHRIEFYPYLSYHRASSDLWEPIGGLGEKFEVGIEQIGSGVYTHIYLFDLIGDCECPTFSKQGNFFKKGFFLLAGLGVDFSQKSINGNFNDGNIDFKASVGAGVDIGVNNLITLSPFLQYQHYPHISWHELLTPAGIEGGNIETSLGQLQVGVRIGLRPDYK